MQEKLEKHLLEFLQPRWNRKRTWMSNLIWEITRFRLGRENILFIFQVQMKLPFPVYFILQMYIQLAKSYLLYYLALPVF